MEYSPLYGKVLRPALRPCSRVTDACRTRVTDACRTRCNAAWVGDAG